MPSDFSMDKEARKRYLRLPKTIFFLTVLILPTIGWLSMFLFPDIAGTGLALILGCFAAMPFVALPVAGGYWGYACGRSKTQRLSIRPDGYVSYYNQSGQDEYGTSNDMFYIIREVYWVKVTSRIIKVRFESRLFPLQIPRTFQNDELIIARLEQLQSETKTEPPFIPLEIVKRVGMVICLPVVIPVTIIRGLIRSHNSIKVPGTLHGFEEKEGRHYPRISFSTKEGQLIDKVDYECPIEDILKDAAADRMLRKKYPKQIFVDYRKNNPDDFTGDFI